MSEARAWLNDVEGLTVAQVKAFLDRLPGDALLLDGSDETIDSIEVAWEIPADG